MKIVISEQVKKKSIGIAYLDVTYIDSMVFEVVSYTEIHPDGTYYYCDLEEGTCDCLGYMYYRHCKHLKAVRYCYNSLIKGNDYGFNQEDINILRRMMSIDDSDL